MDSLTEVQDFEKELGKNPLVTSDFKILINCRTDWETFEIVDGITVPKEVSMERAKITKLYTDHKSRKLMAGLGPAAQAMFLWVSYELEYGKDYVVMNRKRYMLEHGITSANTYRKGLAELIREKVLGLSLVKHVFWINPEYFFCGSRVAKYPDNVVEYKKKADK